MYGETGKSLSNWEIDSSDCAKIDNTRIELGDYQTPIEFAKKICNILKKQGIEPKYIIEPTCGVGNFIVSGLEVFSPDCVIGVELNKKYCEYARNRVHSPKVSIVEANFFDYDWANISEDIKDDRTLILGNPPWVNNSTISTIDGSNLPNKTNFKGVAGIDALLGGSNFDISEYIILDLVRNFSKKNVTIALLCKFIVAKNVFEELYRTKTKCSYIQCYLFNSKKVFDVSVESCLFVLDFSTDNKTITECSVFDVDAPETELFKFGIKNNKFFSLINDSSSFDGESIFGWRQGVKHDCSKVMELTMVGDQLCNKNMEPVDIEDTYLYPFVKSSDLKAPIITSFKRRVIITQKKPREETASIKRTAPKTWSYLENNKNLFENRKSSIYNGVPEYSIFGIGDYSFMKYKVAISGLYKKPFFSLVYSEKPVMLDDTCYQIAFEHFTDAYLMMVLLNSEKVISFIDTISFKASQRPYSKKVLNRIDVQKILNEVSLPEMNAVEFRLGLEPLINEEIINKFVNRHLRQSRLDYFGYVSNKASPAL